MKFTQIIAILFVGTSLTVIGDIFLKRSNGLQSWSNVIMGILFYSVVALPVALAFKYIEFGIVFLIWEAMIVTTAIFVGHFYFHESFTLFKILAVISAAVTVVLSYFANKA